MARKKSEPESHLIDGMDLPTQELAQPTEVSIDAFIALQGTCINLGNNLMAAQMEIDHLKRRVDELARVVQQNWGKVI